KGSQRMSGCSRLQRLASAVTKRDPLPKTKPAEKYRRVCQRSEAGNFPAFSHPQFFDLCEN
ncbi:hypothetical protein SD208_18405, partial [Ochrobactrum sp. BD67]